MSSLLLMFSCHTLLSLHCPCPQPGYQLDRNHELRTVLLSQYDLVVSTPDEFVPPSTEEYDEEKDNLQSWLLNPDCYDQFVAHHSNKLTVAFNAREAPIIVEEREVSRG